MVIPHKGYLRDIFSTQAASEHVAPGFEPAFTAGEGNGGGIFGIIPLNAFTITIMVGLSIFFVMFLLNERKVRSAKSAISTMPNFSATQMIFDGHGSGLAVDEKRKSICLVWVPGILAEATARVIGYSDLVGSEIHEDGHTITQASRASQAGGMLVGGLLLGRVGAIVGGLSGTTRSKSKVQRIDLRLIVNDTQSPVHVVNFLSTPVTKGGFVRAGLGWSDRDLRKVSGSLRVRLPA